MTFILTILMAFTVGFTGAQAQAPSHTPSQAPSQGVTQAPITAPTQALTYVAPAVTTHPATTAQAHTAPTQPALKAPVAPAIKAPTQAPKQVTASPKAPVKAAKTAPKARCEEDQPCWDCKTMGNRMCGPTAKGQAEAWKNFETNGFTEDELSAPMTATYLGMVNQNVVMPDGHEYYFVPSSTKGMDHLFELKFGK